MNAQPWPAEQCPKCEEAQSVELTADLRLCLHCRHEWNPSITFGPVDAEGRATPLAPLVAVPDQPTDYPPDDLYAQAAHARSLLLGAEVAMPALGAIGNVNEITDDGWAIVWFDENHYVIVGPDEFTATGADVIPDETIAAIVTTDLAVAAQIIRAGAESLIEQDGTRRLTLAPDGFLPDDPDVMPVIEHGASYAIAVIATTVGIPTEQLLSIAEMLDDAARAAESE